MDYFNDIRKDPCCLWRVRELLEFIKNILISVLIDITKVLRVWNDMRVSN